MIPELLIAPSGGKGIALLFGLLASAGIPFFGLSDTLMEQSFWGALIAILAATAGKYWANRPKIIDSMSEARSADSTRLEVSTQALIDRINDAHAREVKTLVDSMNHARERADGTEAIAQQVRMALNATLEVNQTMMFHVQHLEQMLREAGVTPPEYHHTPLSEILNKRDEAVAQVLDERRRSGRIALPLD